MRQTDAAATAAGIPGLVIRPYGGEADLPELARNQSAEWEADGVSERASVDELRAWRGNPSEQFDPARDVDIVEVDGRGVALTQRDWMDATDGVREYRARGWSEPAFRRRGLGRMLLTRDESVQRSLAASHETDRPLVLGMGGPETNLGAQALARAFGYQPARWFTDMERSLLGVADNPSGAFGLYESAGFHPTQRFVAWRNPMEEPAR